MGPRSRLSSRSRERRVEPRLASSGLPPLSRADASDARLSLDRLRTCSQGPRHELPKGAWVIAGRKIGRAPMSPWATRPTPERAATLQPRRSPRAAPPLSSAPAGGRAQSESAILSIPSPSLDATIHQGAMAVRCDFAAAPRRSNSRDTEGEPASRARKSKDAPKLLATAARSCRRVGGSRASHRDGAPRFRARV